MKAEVLITIGLWLYEPSNFSLASERVTLGSIAVSPSQWAVACAVAVLGMISSACKSHDFFGDFEGGGRDMNHLSLASCL